MRAKLFIAWSLLAMLPSFVHAQNQLWRKHTITEQGHCNTAVALDANGDALLDVIASMNGKVSLFIAPEWRETILYRFPKGKPGCIHSSTIDADRDGDTDWVGTLSNAHPFWLENPGRKEAKKGAWTAREIDPVITGIHCIITSDIDNDGRDDLVINNFEPEKGIGDSMAWYSVPNDPRNAKQWDRHIFADKDARGGSHYMGAADIDGDGWKEIAVGAKGGPFADGNWFAFWTNPGREGVRKPWKKTILAENQLAATNILPADINGDGKVDWAATRGHSAGVLWFENPTWKIREIDPDIKQPHSLTTADFDRDGDVDLASCGYESEWLRWYENDGKGNFTIHTLDEAQQSYDLRAVDMDGDGDMDLLNAGRGSNNVVWYENRLPSRSAQKSATFLPIANHITTVAGAGGKANNGSSGAFDQVNIGQTFGVELGPDGSLYICEVENHRVWRLNLKTRQAEVVAGNGTKGYSGDGGLAIEAQLNEPYEIRFDDNDNMYIVEMQNHCVRRIDAKDKTISTIAGTGVAGYAGDDGLAKKAQLRRPHSIAIHGHHLFIADIGNHRIRRVDLNSNHIQTIAGNGERSLPQPGLATGKPMVGPRALYVSGDTLWIALREGHSVWTLHLNDGQLAHVAGRGKKGYSGDGGSAKTATFNGPKGIVVDKAQRVYVVDTENQAIRRIDTASGLITTVAGNGKRGFSGDQGLAIDAMLDRPHGICVDSNGNVFVGDTNNHRVRTIHDPLPD